MLPCTIRIIVGVAVPASDTNRPFHQPALFGEAFPLRGPLDAHMCSHLTSRILIGHNQFLKWKGAHAFADALANARLYLADRMASMTAG